MENRENRKVENEVDLMALYEQIGKFNEGLAPAKRNGEMFHIEQSTIPAYNERFDWVGRFQNGSAPAEKDGKRFEIDRNGKKIDK